MSFAGASTGGAGGDDRNPRRTLGKYQRQASPPSRKLTKRGKGGPDNASCSFRGARQRSSGKWVSEIRDPNCRSRRLWLGSYRTSRDAAIAYDNAAYRFYGGAAPLNFPDRIIHRQASAVPEVAPPPARSEMVQLSAGASSGSGSGSGSNEAPTMTVAEEGGEEFWRELEDLPDWEAMGKFPWA